ncbi:hypothetical protein P5673_030113 [Acropora cervicornis]|uniref:Uncharacterized protein n=1 Tax=Acropora cervicornis TaxID=6130 RepID=A0AAD9UTK7_ACRCE|nr:hypothetical protein P5673_030113 [Acropora cervicornis]
MLQNAEKVWNNVIPTELDEQKEFQMQLVGSEAEWMVYPLVGYGDLAHGVSGIPSQPLAHNLDALHKAHLMAAPCQHGVEVLCLPEQAFQRLEELVELETADEVEEPLASMRQLQRRKGLVTESILLVLAQRKPVDRFPNINPK